MADEGLALCDCACACPTPEEQEAWGINCNELMMRECIMKVFDSVQKCRKRCVIGCVNHGSAPGWKSHNLSYIFSCISVLK